MSAKKAMLAMMIISLICLFGGISRADDTDEAALFTSSLSPDALIILDLSGSMDWNPAGGDDIWGSTSCSGTFYSWSGTGHSTKCSRLAIAKRAIFSILDDNGDGTINSSDETSLGVRIGYMRFYDANEDDTGLSYTTGSVKLINAIGVKYSNIFCAKSSSCTISSTCTGSCINSSSANGGTPLAAALNEGKLYLDDHKTADGAAGACRQKFAVLITDGADTFACSGSGTETQSTMYKRRRATVAMAKQLANAGYKIFVIGFGASMPDYLENTLNWMAYYGGTDNPMVANTGDKTALDLTGITLTSCAASTTTGTCDGSSTACYATSNDPGNLYLRGYAFVASDGDEINMMLNQAFNIIRSANYSFSQASVQLNRTVDENYIYEGTITPISGDPFWLGHLKKYTINTDGTRGTELWDAGTVLMSTAASSRVIKTYKTVTTEGVSVGTLIDFTTGNLTNADLGVTTDANRSLVVGFFRGESAYNIESWKLGDIFRSKPITVGTPSFFFEDKRDSSNAFASYRSSHVRASDPYSGRVVLVGANDGQLHAFKTSDGSEAWSFVPPNELSRLKMIAHNTHPTTLVHQSYVDGPVTVADAWVPSSWGTGTSKSASDWQTILLFGEGQGAGTNLWSSSTNCDTGFNQIYTTTYPYYCGFYALNVTSTLSPVYKWRFHGLASAGVGAYIGAPWSTAQVGRVKDGSNEKWVAFIGGGYPSPGATNSGKGLFAFNMNDGSLLWSYTKYNNSSLNYAMPAPPTIVDSDSDGFIDTVYIGDLGDNMWRFKLCLATDGDSCGTGSWSGGLLFDASASNIRPVFTAATVAKDTYNRTWVYWGTGDKLDPTSPNAQEKLIACMDNDRTTTWNYNDLDNLTSSTSTWGGTSNGWYINLTGQGEKMLAEPTVFGGVVYFTTYTPPSGNNPCAQGGTASLYGINYTSGAGAIDNSNPASRSMVIGTGIPSAPVVSMRPGNDTTPDLYVTTSGGGGTAGSTSRVNMNPRGLSNRTNIIYWRDTRIE